jgi:hypothetical protein
MRRSGAGLPPAVASYVTGSDHRRQVEAADIRRAKRRDAKRRRRLDAIVVAGVEAAPTDILPARIERKHTGWRH